MVISRPRTPRDLWSPYYLPDRTMRNISRPLLHLPKVERLTHRHVPLDKHTQLVHSINVFVMVGTVTPEVQCAFALLLNRRLSVVLYEIRGTVVRSSLLRSLLWDFLCHEDQAQRRSVPYRTLLINEFALYNVDESKPEGSRASYYSNSDLLTYPSSLRISR